MVDAGGPGVRSIAANMLASSNKKTLGGGVVGNILEGITGEIAKANEAVEDFAQKSVAADEALSKLRATEDELADAHEKFKNGTFALAYANESYDDVVKRLTDSVEKLTEQHNEAAEEMNTSREVMEDVTSSSGLMSNGFVALAAKVGALTSSFFSFRSALESVDKRLGFTAKQMQLTGDFTGDYGDAVKYAWEEGNKWNETINETNMQLAKMGVAPEEAASIMNNLADGMRLTTNNAGDLRENVGQMTQDIAHMSALLQTSTEDLASATTAASKKFGKGTKQMADDMAGMWDALKQVQQGSKDTVVHIGDLTQATLESQASFQGYNFNLRQQATLMGNIATKAQEQGASYEASMKAAAGLTDILQGGAPDWAKYIAGNKLLGQLKKTTKDAKGTMADFSGSLEEQFGADVVAKMSEQQKKGLKNIAQNYKKYGALSSANMTEELLRGTEAGNQAMFNLLKKHGTGNEGRELLKRVWGLDDAAATAATLALETGATYKEFAELAEKGKQEAADKKPPTMKDVREQTEKMVNAYGMTKSGIGGTLKAILGAINDRPWVNTIVGAISGVSGVLLQLMQMRSVMGGARGLIGGGAAGGGILGKLKGGLGKAKTGIGSLLTKAGGLVGLGGAGAASSGGAAAAGGGAAAAGGAGALATGGAALAAGAVGAAVGTGLRYLSDEIKEATDGFIPSIDDMTQGLYDFNADVVNTVSFGLLDFRAELSESEQAQKRYSKAMEEGGASARMLKMSAEAASGELDKNSAEYLKASNYLKNLTEGDLEGMAEVIGVTTKELKKLQEQAPKSQAEFMAELAKREGKSPVTSEDSPAAAAAKKAGARKKEPPVVAVNKLSAAQKKAVSQQVATQLGPEVKEMSVSMFEKMATQSTEFFEGMTSTSNFFWQDNLPTLASESFAMMAEDFRAKMTDITSPTAGLVPLVAGEEGAEGGAGGLGGASIGPDGSLLIKFMVPRSALDASKRMTKAYTE